MSGGDAAWTVRLHGERIVLRLGDESAELTLGGDGFSGGAWDLVRAVRSRIAEADAKRRRATLAAFAPPTPVKAPRRGT